MRLTCNLLLLSPLVMKKMMTCACDWLWQKPCKHVLQWVHPCKDPASAWSWAFANPNDGKYSWTSVYERGTVVCILQATNAICRMAQLVWSNVFSVAALLLDMPRCIAQLIVLALCVCIVPLLSLYCLLPCLSCCSLRFLLLVF